MAKEKAAPRKKFGRPLMILFFILIALVAVIGAFKWNGTNIAKWGTNLPVVSTFFSNETEKGGSAGENQQMKLEARAKNQQGKIADLQQSISGKDNKIKALQDQVSSLQQQLDLKNREATQKQDQKYKDIARMYSEMKPANAAAVLDQLKDDQAVLILSQQKAAVSAAILEQMDPKKAAKLTDLLTQQGQ